MKSLRNPIPVLLKAKDADINPPRLSPHNTPEITIGSCLNRFVRNKKFRNKYKPYQI